MEKLFSSRWLEEDFGGIVQKKISSSRKLTVIWKFTFFILKIPPSRKSSLKFALSFLKRKFFVSRTAELILIKFSGFSKNCWMTWELFHRSHNIRVAHSEIEWGIWVYSIKTSKTIIQKSLIIESNLTNYSNYSNKTNSSISKPWFNQLKNNQINKFSSLHHGYRHLNLRKMTVTPSLWFIRVAKEEPKQMEKLVPDFDKALNAKNS